MIKVIDPEVKALGVGDEVFVVESARYGREGRIEKAVVKEAARIWLVLEQAESDLPRAWKRTWRMRRDTQKEGGDFAIGCFRTPAQHEKFLRYREALAFLNEQGIRLDRDSAWKGREAALARMLGAQL